MPVCQCKTGNYLYFMDTVTGHHHHQLNIIIRILRLVSQLVSWCFKPSQPQRITSGLNTNYTLSPSQSFHKSSNHKVMVFFFSLFIFRGHSAREPASSRVTQFILRAYTGTMCQPQPTQGKIGRGFGKNAGEWTGSVEISKKEIPGSKRSMYGYILTYSRL